MNLNINKTYVLGLSGGPDSIFLLNYLIENGVNKIVACHINYNYRKDSKIDEDICKDICKFYNIKLEILDMKENYLNFKGNFESWAREVRYNFFVKNVKKYQAEGILIAHNMNDLIETFLMQLQSERMVNFYGINYETYFGKHKIVRPILNFKKSYILKFLDERNCKYAIDETNFDLKYTRNQIRSKLKEEEFEKYIHEINDKNKVLKNILKEIELKNTDFILSVKNFKNDNEFDLRLLFRYFELKGFGNYFYKTKKSVLKEILKQLKSCKSFIKIKFKDFILIKDYSNVWVFKNEELEIFERNLNDDEQIKNNINIAEVFDIIITNDWEKWQSKINYGSKKLSEFYRENKISYVQRYKNILIFDKTKKILLNKIY